jgi:hypothetical protein
MKNNKNKDRVKTSAISEVVRLNPETRGILQWGYAAKAVCK